MVWDCIPAQFAKENKKFIYGVIKEGARAKDFELAIQWLTDLPLARSRMNVRRKRANSAKADLWKLKN
jgi:hypothetical protein